jgi:hypothetical protein
MATAVCRQAQWRRCALVAPSNGFTAQFPEIARACEKLPADTLIDGEVVAIDDEGHVSRREKAEKRCQEPFTCVRCDQRLAYKHGVEHCEAQQA